MFWFERQDPPFKGDFPPRREGDQIPVPTCKTLYGILGVNENVR